MSEKEQILEIISKLKNEIEKIKTYEILQKSYIKESERKCKKTEKELLNYKEKINNNYSKFMEDVKRQETLECEKIDADLSRIQKEFIEYKEVTQKDISSLLNKKSYIENELKKISIGFPKHIKDEYFCELPEILPIHTFKHTCSFQPIQIDVCSPLESPIFQTEKDLSPKYAAEEERLLKLENDKDCFQLSDKFIYAFSADKKTIIIYSLETLDLLKTIQRPTEIDYYPYIHSIEKSFYIIGEDYITKKLMTFDENGRKLNEFSLPSNFSCISNSEARKVFVVCRKHVILYDPVTQNKETIPISIDSGYIQKCCSLGGNEICMVVIINNRFKMVKLSKGNIVKVTDVRSSQLSSNGSGLVVVVDINKIMYVMNRELDPVFMFEMNYSKNIRQLHMDDDCNVYVLSYDWKNRSRTWYVEKYTKISK